MIGSQLIDSFNKLKSVHTILILFSNWINLYSSCITSFFFYKNDFFFCHSKNFCHICNAVHFEKAKMFANFTVGVFLCPMVNI